MKKIQVPSLSVFDYSKIINDNHINNAISVVNNLIKNGRHRADKPTFQTIDNLFQFEEFSIFEETFIESCKYLLGSEIKINTHAFCYYDFLNNWLKKDRDIQWHDHKESHLVGVMYLKFEDPEINIYSGTEFKNPEIGWTFPKSYTWNIFTGNLEHRPGIFTMPFERYVLTATATVYE